MLRLVDERIVTGSPGHGEYGARLSDCRSGLRRAACGSQCTRVPEQRQSAVAVLAVKLAPERYDLRGGCHRLPGVPERELRVGNVE